MLWTKVLHFSNIRFVYHQHVLNGQNHAQAQLDGTGYADDDIIVLYFMTLASLQNSLPLINQIFGRYKLTINMKKLNQ